MRHAPILKFPSAQTPRRPWTDRVYPADGVRALIALAPELGRRNPAAVATVETVMRNLIGTDGPRLERDEPPRQRAAKATLPATTVTAVLERLGVQDAHRRAQLRPIIRAYLKGRPA
jgi:hypothetical protein